MPTNEGWPCTADVRSSYEHFLRTDDGCRAYIRYCDWLYQPIDSVVSVFRESVAHWSRVLSDRADHIIDLGAGDGRRSHSFAATACREDCSAKLTLVDQSGRLLKRASRRRQPTSITRQFVRTRIADFQPEHPADLVLACHSLFTTPPNVFATTIERSLRPGGVAILISNDSDSLIARTRERLDHLLFREAERRFDINEHLQALTNFSTVARINFTTKWSVHLEDADRFVQDVLYWLSLGRIARVPSRLIIEASRDLCDRAQCKSDGCLQFEEREVLVVLTQS